jgi:hypothetical protein
MVGGDLITIVLVLGIGYWLYSSGQLDKILGSFSQLGVSAGTPAPDTVGPDGPDVEDVSGQQAYAQSNGDVDVDISGKNSGAMVNGKCYGDPAQCAKAQRLLESIQ